VVDASLYETVLYMSAFPYSLFKMGAIKKDPEEASVFSNHNPYYTFYSSRDGILFSHAGFETKFFRNF